MVSRKRLHGSIRKLPSGRWQARYTDPDGLRRTLGTYETKREAEQAWVQAAARMGSGQWSRQQVEPVSFGEYAERWIDERVGLSPRTRKFYSDLLRLHLGPELGSRHLAAVTPAVIRTWRQKLTADGLGPSTLAKSYRLARAIFATAVDDELITRNPCRIKGASQENAAERPVLTVDQVLALADAIEPRYRLVVLLASFASLRWGELMGLVRSDFSDDLSSVKIARSVSEVHGELVIKEPKSAAGRRIVALPAALADEIRHHLDTYAEPGASGRVIIGHRGNTLHRSNWTRIWRPAKEAAGIPEAVHLHDLRHAGNHWVATSGASTRELMARMGHSSMRAALIYQHATAERDRVIAAKLDQVLRPSNDSETTAHIA